MSVPNPNRSYKNSFHWRNDSDELDVFEAAGYFSTVNDPIPGSLTTSFQKILREDRHHAQKPGRMSLDNLAARNPFLAEFQKQIKESHDKKFKQPSSPGGRLASFLNSLFNQASLKKKKKPKSVGATAAEEDNSPGWRRKRRSSISHFRITTAADTKAAACSSSSDSGSRTPPPYVNTPTKLYREFRSLPDRRQAIDPNSPANCKNKISADCEKFRTGNPGIMKRNSSKDNLWELRISGDGGEDGGADSDSSSDLFDLPNHELDLYSRDLPVYGTTDVDRIKKSAPISSATT